MPTQIRLAAQQITDLAVIRDLGPEKIKDVVAHLQNLKTLPLRPTALQREIKSVLGNEGSTEHLMRPVLALSQLIRQREMTVEEVLEGLRHGIKSSDPQWTSEEQTSWNEVESPLKELFGADAVRTVSKAIDLAYEYANLFHGARIISDIRPVFNDDNAEELKIDGAVVSYTLRLHYDNREGNHSLSIALDESDVHLIREQCERALQKAKHIKTTMQDQFPTIIFGEASDESKC